MAWTTITKVTDSWTKQSKVTAGATPDGWGALAWGDGAWGSPAGTAWSKQSKATDSWTKQTKATV